MKAQHEKVLQAVVLHLESILKQHGIPLDSELPSRSTRRQRQRRSQCTREQSESDASSDTSDDDDEEVDWSLVRPQAAWEHLLDDLEELQVDDDP